MQERKRRNGISYATGLLFFSCLDVGRLHWSMREGESQTMRKRAEDGGREGCNFLALLPQITADAVS